MAILTIFYCAIFELLGSNINKGRDPRRPNDRVFDVLNMVYGLIRMVFTGYGFLKLLPYLVFDDTLVYRDAPDQMPADHTPRPSRVKED